MGKNELMQYVENLTERKSFPEFKAGDTITVHYKIREGNKERIQNFQGVVIQRNGSGSTETFTIMKQFPLTLWMMMLHLFIGNLPECVFVALRASYERTVKYTTKNIRTDKLPAIIFTSPVIIYKISL